MILYLDTSALVKLYVEEEHSQVVREWVYRADTVACSEIAYAEVASALNRAFKEKRISKKDLNTLWETFLKDWRDLTLVLVAEEVLSLAVELIFRHGLRAFDGLHLAAALLLARQDEVVFVAFDKKLLQAAEKEGLILPG